jgi:hypothetical protein
MKKQNSMVLLSLITIISLTLFSLIPASGNELELRKPIPYSAEMGSETIACTNTPKLNEYFRTYSPHRLAFQALWVVANVMDKEGKKYNVVREYKTSDSTLILASQSVPDLKSQAIPIFKPEELYTGQIASEIDDEKGYILVKPLIPIGPSFSIVIRPQHVVWKEGNNLIDLEFKAVAPALEFYTPGKWEDDMYRSEPCSVKGTINGNSVSGFGVIDNAWGSIGVSFEDSKIYKVLEEHWSAWQNIYKDGSVEGGTILDGVDKFKFCYYYKNGKARVSHNCKTDVAFAEDGFITGAAIKMDELKFQYSSESRVIQSTAHVVWASGIMINLSEPEKPVKSFTWWEYFPKTKK